jgi:hypothetical protein
MIQPHAVADLSGSAGSHLSQLNERRLLASGAGARIRFVPQLRQVGRSVCPTASICHLIRRLVHSKWNPAGRIVFFGRSCSQQNSLRIPSNDPLPHEFDTSGKSPAYLHHRKNFEARAGKPAAGFLNRTAAAFAALSSSHVSALTRDASQARCRPNLY